DAFVQLGELGSAGQRLGGQVADQIRGDRFAGHGDALPLGAGEGLFGQGVDAGGAQAADVAQVVADAAAASLADLGRGDVAGQQRQVGLVGGVDDAFQAGVDGGQQVPQPVDPAGLLDHQLAAAADQQPQLGVELAGRLHGAQFVAAQPDLIGDDLRVAGIGLVFPAAGGLPGTVDRQ